VSATGNKYSDQGFEDSLSVQMLQIYIHGQTQLQSAQMVPTTLQNSFSLTFQDKMNHFP